MCGRSGGCEGRVRKRSLKAGNTASDLIMGGVFPAGYLEA
jgi:hypothetical protein